MAVGETSSPVNRRKRYTRRIPDYRSKRMPADLLLHAPSSPGDEPSPDLSLPPRPTPPYTHRRLRRRRTPPPPPSLSSLSSPSASSLSYESPYTSPRSPSLQPSPIASSSSSSRRKNSKKKKQKQKKPVYG